MARWARVVVPGLPHHIIQRGNPRHKTFFRQEDYAAYLELMSQCCREHRVEIWAYCLMPNHVHLIAVPRSKDGLRRALGEAHRRYARGVNWRRRGAAVSGKGVSLPTCWTSRISWRPLATSSQSGTRQAGRRAERLSLEQCAGTPQGQGRRLGERIAAAGDRRKLASPAGPWGESTGLEAVPREQTCRPRAGRRAFSEAAGEEARPRPPPSETRPQNRRKTLVSLCAAGGRLGAMPTLARACRKDRQPGQVRPWMRRSVRALSTFPRSDLSRSWHRFHHLSCPPFRALAHSSGRPQSS